MAALAKLREEPPAVRVVEVDRGGRAPFQEEPLFRCEVSLERAVVVEMVVAEIREDQRREADAVEAPQVGVVRRRLDRAAEVPAVEHRPEGALEVERHRAPGGDGVRSEPIWVSIVP